MKMADDDPRNDYYHHQIKHGGTSSPYLDYNIKNKTSEIIKAYANVKKVRVARKLTEIDSTTRNRRNASNKSLPDMSVREVIF